MLAMLRTTRENVSILFGSDTMIDAATRRLLHPSNRKA